MFCLLKLTNAINPRLSSGKRSFWQWLNIIFNSVDEDRRKLYGPDRTCAEWLLRNGASVKWTTSKEYLTNYNHLPSEDIKLYIKEVDASESSISHYGFPHFVGCKHIEKIVLHKCGYIEDEALPLLKPLKKTLKFLQVSECGNITDTGLNALAGLDNLQTLIILNLQYIKDKEAILKNLTENMPKCSITFK